MFFSGGSSLTLRVVVRLAELQRKVTASELAELSDVAYDHLIKIVQKLKAARIINTSRGKSGGIWLIRDPKELTVGEVFRATTGPIYFRDCLFDPSYCKFIPNCKIREFYLELSKCFDEKLDETTVADLVSEPLSE